MFEEGSESFHTITPEIKNIPPYHIEAPTLYFSSEPDIHPLQPESTEIARHREIVLGEAEGIDKKASFAVLADELANPSYDQSINAAEILNQALYSTDIKNTAEAALAAIISKWGDKKAFGHCREIIVRALTNKEFMSDPTREVLISEIKNALVNGMEQEHTSDLSAWLINNLITNDNDKTGLRNWALEQIAQHMDTLHEKLERAGNFGDVLKKLAENYCNMHQINVHGSLAMHRYIASFGLDPYKLTEIWKESFSYAWSNKSSKLGLNPFEQERFSRSGDFAPILTRNLNTMMRLRQYHPDSVGVLYNQFGIKDYGRYDSETLIAQYEHRDDITSPYVVNISSQSDWNGSLYVDSKDQDTIRKALARQGILLRIIEAPDLVKVYKKLYFFNKKYNTDGNNKIRGAILNGHGNSDVFQLGEIGPYETHLLTYVDFQDPKFWHKYLGFNRNPLIREGIKRTQEFFHDQSHFFLWACTSNDLAREASKRIAGTFTGVGGIHSVSGVKTEVMAGIPFIHPVTVENRNRTYRSGKLAPHPSATTS